MPLTIAAVALLGSAAMGLSAGAAIILGAAVAPTDPVLAGDIGVGPPGDEEEREPNFSITGEAGLNDGLALPVPAAGRLRRRPGGHGLAGRVAAGRRRSGRSRSAWSLGAALGYGLGGARRAPARPRAAGPALRRLAGDRRGPGHLRRDRGAVRAGLRGGVRGRRRLPALRARARVQRARPRRGRHGREVRRAGGRPAAGDARHARRAAGARARRLAARRRRRPRPAPGRGAGLAAGLGTARAASARGSAGSACAASARCTTPR